ncbi:MAG: hypothetical protein HOW73_08460 [Polyangiaceae bacterium]|nr:hypothetical protein [Polyangiaceae bacterium]
MRRATWALVAAGACALAACEIEGDSEPTLDVEGPDATPLVRPDTPGNALQFNFDRGDLVESFGSANGRFLIHYARSGPNAVPAADGDASGVPDFVEEVASVYEDVLTFYETTLGFRPPVDDAAIDDNGGSPAFDVYLVDFAGVGDGVFRVDECDADNPDRCAGFMTQENDYAGYGYPSTFYANRILGSHEFFHAVQAAYDNEQGSVLGEGTAVWATEMYDPDLEDFEAFIPGYLDNPDRPLDEPLPGPVDPFSYGSAIFFKFLEERYGAEAVRAIWEQCENGAGGVADPQWLDVLDGVVAGHGGTSFADAFVEFATWNLKTDDFADPATSYADGADYPRVLIDDVEAPYTDDAMRVYHASTQYLAMSPGGRAAMTAVLVPPADNPDAADGLRLLIGVERDEAVELVEVADPTVTAEPIDTQGASRFVVTVVNTATGGDSKKPALCAGTPEEVDACRASLGSGEGGAGGGGGGTGGSDDTGGSGGGGGDGDDAADDGCNCNAAGEASDVSTFAPWMMLAVAGLLSRRAKSFRGT